MKPGRNDPCPCGSGKKYKHCCAREDAAAAPVLSVLGHRTRNASTASTQEATRHPVPWEADVSPLPLTIESDPTSRPVAIIIATDDVVVHSDIEMHPPSDAEGVAGLILIAIEQLVTGGSAMPSMVRVRHPNVAEQLGRMLRQRGVLEVVSVERLPVIGEFAAGLRQQLHTGSVSLPPISNPQTWAAWQLPPEALSGLLASAATFYAASPWSFLTDGDVLEVGLPSGSRWFACVLGNAGEQYGLVLYEDLDDAIAIIEGADGMDVLTFTSARVVSLSFDVKSGLTRAMRQEFRTHGWPIAGPGAYPSLWTLGTVGGGLSEPLAHDLGAALDAVAAFAPPSGTTDEVWEKGVDGVTVRWAFEPGDPPLWDIPELLFTSAAEGETADPSAIVAKDQPSDADAGVIARFVANETSAGATEARVAQDRSNVELFVEVMHHHQGVRLPALTEYDLRVLLYDLLPRKTPVSRSVGDGIRTSIRRFCRYLGENESLRYPWADAILRDKRSYSERWESFPGGHWWDAEVADWMRVLYDDLMHRVMTPSEKLSGLGEWSAEMGMQEAMLRDRLQREWLVWRDEEIRAGTAEADALGMRLEERQVTWETSPHPAADGRPPVEVIAAERAARKRVAPRKGGKPRRR